MSETVKLTFRVSPDEKKKIDKTVKAFGFKSQNDYFKALLSLDKDIYTVKRIELSDPDKKLLNEYKEQLKRIGNNINQMTIRMNIKKMVPKLETLEKIDREIQQEIIKINDFISFIKDKAFDEWEKRINGGG